MKKSQIIGGTGTAFVVATGAGVAAGVINSEKTKSTNENIQTVNQKEKDVSSETKVLEIPTLLTKVTTNKEKLMEFNFVPLEDSESDWRETITAYKTKYTTHSKKENSVIKKECETFFEEEFTDGKEKTEDFKESVNKCTRKISFEKRAEILKIDLISGDKENWDSRLVDYSDKEIFEKVVDNSASYVSSSTENVINDDLKFYCVEAKNLSFEEFSEEVRPIEEEWVEFLKMCAQEKSKSSIDYWTGKKSSI